MHTLLFIISSIVTIEMVLHDASVHFSLYFVIYGLPDTQDANIGNYQLETNS